MTTHTRTTIALGLTLFAGCLISSSAQGRPRGVQEVAIPVKFISAQDITHSTTLDLSTVRDLTTHVPHQPNGQPIFVRGLGESTIGGSGAQTIGLFGGLEDIQKIEVIRGPQGSLYGSDRQAGVVTLFTRAGHLDNVTYDPNQDHSSSYVSAGIGYRNQFDLGAGKLSLAAGLAYTYYDNKFEYRDGDDSYLHDFYLQGRYTQEISPSARLDINLDLNYGEHGTVPRGYTWAGTLQSPVFDFKADGEVTFRTDGGALDAPGLVHRSGIHFGGFREKQGEYVDSTRLSLSHELIFQRTQTDGFYARLEAGAREWKVMSDYDSTRTTAVAGLFGKLPCGAQFRVGGGFEFREYDDDYLDDRTVPTLEGLILGRVGDVRYSIGARYGIFEKFANWGGGNGVDMEGLEFGARFHVPLTPKLTFGAALESSYMKAESSDYARGHVHYLHGGISVGYDFSEDTKFNFNAGLDRVTVNGGMSSNTDTFSSFSFGVKRQF